MNKVIMMENKQTAAPPRTGLSPRPAQAKPPLVQPPPGRGGERGKGAVGAVGAKPMPALEPPDWGRGSGGQAGSSLLGHLGFGFALRALSLPRERG